MARVANIVQPVRRQILAPPSVYSRVLSMVAIAKFQGNTDFAISTAFGDTFRVLSVRVWVRYTNLQAGVEVWFRLTTGVGKLVDYTTVYNWEPIIPLIWENHQVSWIADASLFEYNWSLDRRLSGDGRRLGVTAFMSAGGVSIANVNVSYEVSEG